MGNTDIITIYVELFISVHYLYNINRYMDLYTCVKQCGVGLKRSHLWQDLFNLFCSLAKF